MTIGERKKKIRVFRKMTMDELGGALGFEGKNMSVRISQYETGARIPGEDMILKLADALHCNYKAISDYSLGAAEDIIETLFWLEESATSLPARGKGTRFPEYTAPGNLIHTGICGPTYFCPQIQVHRPVHPLSFFPCYTVFNSPSGTDKRR